MKRKIAAGGVAVALVALSMVVAAAAKKPDFNGKWVMDKAKSEGVPPSVKGQVMTVTQTGDKIELETKVTMEQGDRVIKDSYTADGKEVDFIPQGPQGAIGKGKRTANWAAEGAVLEVSETATLENGGDGNEISATRKWTLEPDGKTLTIEMAFSGEQGLQKTKRVFVKQ